MKYGIPISRILDLLSAKSWRPRARIRRDVACKSFGKRSLHLIHPRSFTAAMSLTPPDRSVSKYGRSNANTRRPKSQVVRSTSSSHPATDSLVPRGNGAIPHDPPSFKAINHALKYVQEDRKGGRMQGTMDHRCWRACGREGSKAKRKATGPSWARISHAGEGGRFLLFSSVMVMRGCTCSLRELEKFSLLFMTSSLGGFLMERS